MDKDYFQMALHTFNTDKPNWYNWETYDGENKIPPKDRMQYKYIKVMVPGAVIPSEADLNTKIQELKDAETQKENNKISAQNKLKALGLTDAEIEAL